MSGGRIIKADDKLTLKAPRYDVNTNSYYLVNAPPFNNANTQIMSRNTATGEMQLVDRNASNFITDLTNAGTDVALVVNPGFAASHSIKSIAAGSNINVTPGIDHITISTPLDGKITQNNRGAGVPILHDTGSQSTFTFKTLVPGTHMSLSSNDDEVTINTTLSGFISQNNLGAGEHILSDPGTDERFNFKTLIAGNNITLTSDANTITISNSSDIDVITQTNLGVGAAVLSNPGTDSSFAFKTLKAGPNILLNTTPNDITIVNQLTGEITQTNVGTGSGVLFDTGTNDTFHFKSINAGTNITVTNDNDNIFISTPLDGTIKQHNSGSGGTYPYQ